MMNLLSARKLTRLPPMLASAHKRNVSDANKSVGVKIPLNEVRPFVERAVIKVGAKRSHAETVADCLFAADYRGHFSHGLQRVDIYVNELKAGVTSGKNEPRIVKERGGAVLVDGGNVLGAQVGMFCMQVALRKAKEHGIAIVAARRTNHYGICAFYTSRALQHGLIGMSMTNTSPIMQVTRGRYASLGTHPISIAAPVTRPAQNPTKVEAPAWRRGIVDEQPDDFVLDMATTTVAYGKVEMAAKRNDAQIPSGWSTDSRGEPTNDPQEARRGFLLPLGGDELRGSYKAYGLALAVELLCGIIANAAYGPRIRVWSKVDGEANLGQCFIAIDPQALNSGFGDRLASLVQLMRSAEPREPGRPVLIPGDPEREHMRKCDAEGVITYHQNVIAALDKLADDTGVERMKRA